VLREERIPPDSRQHRICGLKPDSTYRFVLAASNALGTSRWSVASATERTLVGRPAAPASALLLLTSNQGMKPEVELDVIAGDGTGGRPLRGFRVLLYREGVEEPVERGLTTEMSAGKQGRIVHCWKARLERGGRHTAKIWAENSEGMQSEPAEVSLDVTESPSRPLFAPRWAEEPIMVLGPSAECSVLGEEGERSSSLRVMLFWHDRPDTCDGGSWDLANAEVDVFAHHRLKGLVACVALATAVRAARLEVVLPVDVPMALELHARRALLSSGGPGGHVVSEPLFLELGQAPGQAPGQTPGQAGERLGFLWSIWSERAQSWRALPSSSQQAVEYAWLFGTTTLTLIEPVEELLPGEFELSFGNGETTQHILRVPRGAGRPSSRGLTRKTLRPNGEVVQPVVSTEDCMVCFTRPRTHAFMHSHTMDGHLAVCEPCALSYSSGRHGEACPVCRSPFNNIQRIFV